MMDGQVELFGRTKDGQEVHRITLRAGEVTASILTLGAVVQDLKLAGVPYGLTQGSDLVADYEGDMRHHGALISPVVNRLTGAQATVNGTLRHFQANQDGRHTLHSGAVGSHLAVWKLAQVAADAVSLTLDMADGTGGFPGNRQITARFSVLAPATLRLEISATTDAPTIFNATNHSYWNLDGTEIWDGHTMQIAADAYLPTTGDFIPTGEIAAVQGTAFDFRTARVVTAQHPPLDNNFCLGTAQEPLREVMWLQGQSGVRMAVATTEPGLQIYDGRNAARPGHGPYEGIAVETQGWPDAPNHAQFPPITLLPGAPLIQITEWRFQTG